MRVRIMQFGRGLFSSSGRPPVMYVGQGFMSNEAGRSDVVREKIVPRHSHLLSHSEAGFHRIAYVEWGDPKAEKVALCVHGLSRQGRDFDMLAVELVRRGYRVVCPDLPGRGRSDWLTNPDLYHLPQYAADMTAMLARIDVETIDWIGTSLGGLVGIMVAAQEKTPIRRMIINDIGPLVPWAALNRIGFYLRQQPAYFPSFAAAEIYFREILAPFGKLTDEEWNHLTEYSIERERDGRWRMLVDPRIARNFGPSIFYNLSLWRYWDAIHCPVLLLRGVESDLLPEDVATLMTQRGPRAELVEIEDCGHAPALMDHYQISVVADWLGRRQ